MVEKVMPFFESFVALEVSAEKLFDNSFRSGIFQLKDQVIRRLRYFTVFDLFSQLRCGVKLVSRCDFNL